MPGVADRPVGVNGHMPRHTVTFIGVINGLPAVAQRIPDPQPDGQQGGPPGTAACTEPAFVCEQGIQIIEYCCRHMCGFLHHIAEIDILVPLEERCESHSIVVEDMPAYCDPCCRGLGETAFCSSL